MAACEKPTILVLSVGEAFQDEIFDDGHAHVINALLEKAEVKRAKTVSGAMQVLNGETRLQGVYVVTPGLFKVTPGEVFESTPGLGDDDATRELNNKLVDYVKQGGTVIYGGLISSFTPPSDLTALFRDTWGLAWKSGSYHRTTITVNMLASGLGTGLVQSYSQKSLNLADVARNDCLYLPSEDSRVESHLFPPMPIEDLRETPIAFKKLENGWLGYTGDVNSEQATTVALLHMFRL